MNVDDAKVIFEALDMAARRHDAQATAVKAGSYSQAHHVERAQQMRELRNRIARGTMASLASTE